MIHKSCLKHTMSMLFAMFGSWVRVHISLIRLCMALPIRVLTQYLNSGVMLTRVLWPRLLDFSMIWSSNVEKHNVVQ